MVIEVGFARREDRDRLVEFIRDHWSSTHVFVQRPDVFDWQYLQADGRLNMVMAASTDAPGRPVLGVLGFIPMGRFDPALGDRDVTLAIWKVRDDGSPPGLGLRLLKYLQAQLRPRLIAAIGTSQMVRPIYEVLGYRVGSLHQAAIFNPDRRETLFIADQVPAAAFEPASRIPSSTLELVDVDRSVGAEDRARIDRVAAAATPSKSWDYIVERFVDHPWYRYEVKAVRHRGQLTSVVVWRVVEAEGSRVLRIVDVIGDPGWLADARFALQRRVAEIDAEYVDVTQSGIDPDALHAAGFVSTREHPDLVLPNHFAPFERRRVDIEIAHKVLDGSDAAVRLFRADSDQDRPNQVSQLG